MNYRCCLRALCFVGLISIVPVMAEAQFKIPAIKAPRPQPSLPAEKQEAAAPQRPVNKSPANTPTEPTLRWSDLIVAAQTYQQYYPNPNSTQYDDLTWSWTPTMRMEVNGPIASGSAISVEYTKPDGKPWLEYDCGTSEIAAGHVLRVERGQNFGAKNAIIQTGVFGFKILLRNELKGSNATLFAGKFKVDRFIFNPANNPKYIKNWVYWINEAWRLPIGYVYAAEHGRECSIRSGSDLLYCDPGSTLAYRKTKIG